MLTDQHLEDVLTHADHAKARHAEAFSTLPITPDDLPSPSISSVTTGCSLGCARSGWANANQAVYQATHAWVLNNWPELAGVPEQVLEDAPRM